MTLATAFQAAFEVTFGVGAALLLCLTLAAFAGLFDRE